MESVTSCSICISRFNHREHLPLVLGCGHTFCKHCVSQLSKCPLCRRSVTTTATNLLVFQISSSPNLTVCDHQGVVLFCPLCCFPICVQCVSLHNLHGILPLNDPSIASGIKEKLAYANKKLARLIEGLTDLMRNVDQLHTNLTMSYQEQIQLAKAKFDELRRTLNSREAEILEDLAAVYEPLTSKLQTVRQEFNIALTDNQTQLDKVEMMLTMQDADLVGSFRPIRLRYFNAKVVERIEHRARRLPSLSISIDRAADFVSAVGKIELPLQKRLWLF